MLFYLQSTDPENYNTVKFSANPSLGSEPLLFRINQINTISSFLVTTHTDYIEMTIGSKTTKYYFPDKGDYDKDMIDKQIQKYLPSSITCYINEFNTLSFKSSSKFTITDATHRAKLIIGLYETKLPLESVQSKDGYYYITVNSVPYSCLGNCLYLQSNVSSVAGFNDKENKDVYRSVCYHINEMFIPGIPILSRIPGPKIKILPGDLTKLEFTLVDFQNQPVILKAPLRIVMEVMYDNEIIENIMVSDPNEKRLKNLELLKKLLSENTASTTN